MKPFCFVLMPFGVKTDGNKKEIDFDKVYKELIKPAIEKANLQPIRADEEKSGGFIHKPMYERLMFCDFAVADLSFDNANVFYELGIRHALKPFTTVSIFEINTKLPFDTAALRTFPYEYKEGIITDLPEKIADLAELIKINLNAQNTLKDSPIAELISEYKFPDLNYLRQNADAFNDWAKNMLTSKTALENFAGEWKNSDKANNDPGRQTALEKIKALQQEADSDLAYNYDLLNAFLDTYKSINAFTEITQMLQPVIDTTAKNNIYLRQQLALAYNKIKLRDKAEKILTDIISQYGTDPETNGLLGAVYKGMMDDNKGDDLMMQQYHSKAVDAYLDGFTADPRNYYPGVNALTLMYFNETPDERFNKFFPLVNYAVERQLSNKASDYWLQATALELAALELNKTFALKYLASALFCKPHNWMKATTAKNLQRIYDAASRANNSPDINWLNDIINRLNKDIVPV